MSPFLLLLYAPFLKFSTYPFRPPIALPIIYAVWHGIALYFLDGKLSPFYKLCVFALALCCHVLCCIGSQISPSTPLFPTALCGRVASTRECPTIYTFICLFELVLENEGPIVYQYTPLFVCACMCSFTCFSVFLHRVQGGYFFSWSCFLNSLLVAFSTS